jgi:hypothetical protein
MGFPRRSPLSAWRQPAPWIALVLLAIASTSTQPRLWFWVALLVVVLVVGWIQAIAHLRR